MIFPFMYVSDILGKVVQFGGALFTSRLYIGEYLYNGTTI